MKASLLITLFSLSSLISLYGQCFDIKGETLQGGGIFKPQGLVAKAQKDSSGILLKWSENIEGSFPVFELILRKHDSFNFDTLAFSLDKKFISPFLDTTAMPGIIYTYKVRYSAGPEGFDFNDSNEDTALIKKIDPIGIRELKNSKVVIYPNPTRDFIELKGFSKIKNIQLFNLLGKEFFIEISDQSNELIRVELDDIPSGIYFLKINNITQKFIKK